MNTTEEFLNDPNNRLPTDVCEISWRYAQESMNDPCVGLHIGERKSSAALGLISPLIQSCPDVWTAVGKTSDYMNIISDVHTIIPSKTPEQMLIYFDPNKEWVEKQHYAFRHVMASSIVYALKTISSVTGRSILPQRVVLNHELNETDKREYERVLNCPVELGHRYCGLEYALECGSYPITTRNLELMGIIEQHIIDILRRQGEGHAFTGKVKQTIMRDFGQQFPSIGDVAANLALSIRNLQRRLKEENTNFQALISDVKRELAEDYLKNKALSISEIAYMLGYAEPAVFTRAYKKWTGVPPEVARGIGSKPPLVASLAAVES